MSNKRESNQQSLKEAIERMLQVYKLDRKLGEHDIIDHWDNIVGSMIAKHTKEIYIRNKVLHIRLDSSVVREELHHGKSKLIELINQYSGKQVINDVYLK